MFAVIDPVDCYIRSIDCEWCNRGIMYFVGIDHIRVIRLEDGYSEAFNLSLKLLPGMRQMKIKC